MIKENLYKRTTDILFDAYFNDTLKHGNCYACAVGNIVAANMGFKYRETPSNNCYLPSQHICWEHEENLYTLDSYEQEEKAEELMEATWYGPVGSGSKVVTNKSALVQINSTGYSLTELSRIEEAFESASGWDSREEYMFNGLVAVLEVLKQIHQVQDDEPVIKRFTEHYNTIAK